MKEEYNPVGYINQGCYWYSFDSKPTSYVCELCGSHWTLARINGMESLIDYAMSEAFDCIDYENINTVELFERLLSDDDLYYCLDTFLNKMRIVIEDYNIDKGEFKNMLIDYYKNELENH